MSAQVLSSPNSIVTDHESFTSTNPQPAKFDMQALECIGRTVPGGVENIQNVYPLSPLQEGMLFHHLSDRHIDPYVLSALFELEPQDGVEQLVAAVQAVIQRHDALRTAILWEQLPKPAQVVYCSATVRAEAIELESDQDSCEQLKKLLRPEGVLFDLQRAPLLRLQVVDDRLRAHRYALLRVHHVICDHQSLTTLIAEITANLNGRTRELPRPESYSSFIASMLSDARPQDSQAFFRSKLESVYETTAPFGLLDAAESGSIQEERLALDAGFAKHIRSTAKHVGVSAARMFHAAWALLVAKITGRDDVVFGTVISSDRYGKPSERASVGLSVNTLPLRIPLQGVTAAALVALVDHELSELLAYAHTPLPFAQRCSGLGAGMPLFTTLLNYRHSARRRDASLMGSRVIATGEAFTSYPIALTVDNFGQGFSLIVQTDRRIDPWRIFGYLQAAMESLLRALDEAPQTPALALSILPETERRQVLEQFNATETPFPREKLVHELFEEQVQRTPHAEAVVYEGRSLNYSELNSRANQLAWYLREKGVHPDQLVGLCVERSLEMVVGLLGILKAGGAYLPLDPSYPPERLQYMLSNAAPHLLLTQSHLKDRLGGTGTEAITLDDQWNEVSRHSTSDPNVRAIGLRSYHLAYVIYTSGSTGVPKGVMVTHRNLVASTIARWHVYGESGRFLLLSPVSFDSSIAGIFGTLTGFGTLLIATREMARDPELLSAAIGRLKATSLLCVPSLYRALLESPCSSGAIKILGRVIVAGEACPATLTEESMRRAPGAVLFNEYGPTEATVWATVFKCSNQEPTVPIGRPIANTSIYILDSHRQPVPIGVTGEIYIGGAGVARGYLNQPELTTERFVADPFSTSPQARMYKTGDLGRWRADGTIDYLGRNDEQVKIRGYRIELGEIEAQLVHHQEVRETVVLAREDEPGQKRLVGYVIAKEAAAAPNAESLREHLNRLLPEYMVPSAFVVLEAFPLTPNGKLDRRALPAPDQSSYTQRGYEAARGDVEEILAGIWQELLKVQRVGRNDNFFELGGHSLLIVQLMERLRRVGLSADVRRVFESPTLSDLASALSRGALEQVVVPPNRIPAACEHITPQMLALVQLEAQHIERIVHSVPGGAANIQDIYPLAPLQEGILFHHLLDQSKDAYARPMLLSLASRETLDTFIQALQSVIDRHDILRTAVLWEQLPQPVQVVYRRAILPVQEVTVDRDPLLQLKQEIRSQRYRLDLRKAPLMRLRFAVDSENNQYYALLQTHHLVCDNESIGILLSEVMSHVRGDLRELPKPIAYRNHVAQTLAYTRTQDPEAFFRRKLGDIEEPTAPFGLLDVHGDGSQIEEASQCLELGISRRLRAQARRLSVSAATVFHAAWALVVARTAAQDDVVFGTVLLGRMQGSAGAQRILGMFINTLPLRVPLRAVTAKQLIEHTQRELVELLGHEQSSLALAQRCSGISGSLPLFSTLLNYRHSVLNPDAQWSAESGVTVLETLGGTNYPILVSVDDLGEGFALTAQTDLQIDPQRIVGYLSTALQSLLEALEEAPLTPALSLSILPESERRQTLELFNATKVAYPQNKQVQELFEEQVRRAPSALAVVYEGHSLTYAELNARANKLARYLRHRRIGPDQLVGICVERSLEMVVGVLGILKAGGAYVPLDPSHPNERLQYMLADAAPRVLLTQAHLRDRLPSSDAEVITLDEQWGEIGEQPYDDLDAATLGLTSHHLAYVIYTSGSTGQPKGVMVEHRDILNLWQGIEGAYRRSAACQRIALNASLNFDASVQQFVQLLSGRTIIIIPENYRRDASMLLRLFSESQIHAVDCTPSQLKIWASTGLLQADECPLRMVLVGGESIDSDLWKTLVKCSGTEFYNVYGPTECTVDATVARLKGDITAPHIGHPMENRRVYVLDRNHSPAPIGVAGEIYIAGAGVARGYLNRPELTAERFIADPFGSDAQARLYKTGDLGRWRADGKIEYLGRNDSQVKIRGFRVELGEIEAQLLQHALVKEAVVLARADEPGQKRLVAYVVSRDSTADNAISLETLRAYLKPVLPDYMIPSAFVWLDRLPLTCSGKLNRRALPALDRRAYGDRDYEAPRGEIEEILAGIWQRLLKVERVSRQDNFFELGGHSLLVMRLISRLRECLGVDLAVRDLFESATLEALAERVGAETNEFDGAAPPTRNLGRDITEMSNDEMIAEITRLQTQLTGDIEGGSGSS
jgi:amino acid adenylation domain-containing protein